jgi:hypothetical protein
MDLATIDDLAIIEAIHQDVPRSPVKKTSAGIAAGVYFGCQSDQNGSRETLTERGRNRLVSLRRTPNRIPSYPA